MLGSIFLEAELLSAITLCCCPPTSCKARSPSMIDSHLSLCNVMTLEEKRERKGFDSTFYSGLKYQINQKKINRSKLSQNTKNFEEQYAVPTHLQCFPTHSMSPGSNEIAESKLRWLSCATLKPRQCWMQKLSNKWKKSTLFWKWKHLIFASCDNHMAWIGMRRGCKWITKNAQQSLKILNQVRMLSSKREEVISAPTIFSWYW